MNQLNIIITGSTGMVGKGVLLECLDDQRIGNILLINRNPVGIRHPKIKEILLPDFFQVHTLEEQLGNYDACLFCLGVSSAGMKEDQYRKLTYDLTLHFAKSVLEKNPGLRFVYVSGQGTDSTEQGKMMWARVKGKTENDLMALPFRAAYMFRPGFIEPRRGIRSRTRLYNFLYLLLWPLLLVFRFTPGMATNSIVLGRAMISAITNGYPKTILENRDINILGNIK
ncbi:MAG: hypothetical protein U0T82_16795 [Bacteroidales bacterium]